MIKILKKGISLLVIVVFLAGENAWAFSPGEGESFYKLSVPTRFPTKNDEIFSLAESRLKYNVGFCLINIIIARYLQEKGSSVSDTGLIEYIEHNLGENNDITDLEYREIYKDGKSFCLPYGEENGLKFQIRYFLDKEIPENIKKKKHLIQPVKGSSVRYLCEHYKDKGKENASFSSSEKKPKYKHIEIREWKTGEEIKRISKYLGKDEGITNYLKNGSSSKKAWSHLMNYFDEELKDALRMIDSELISFDPDLKGADVMLVGPGVNEVSEFIKAFPGIKEIHLVSAHKELFDEVDRYFDSEFKDKEKPAVFGYKTNVLVLPEELNNKIDFIYNQNVFDPGVFGVKQLEMAADSIYKSLKKGGLYMCFPYQGKGEEKILTLLGSERNVLRLDSHSPFISEVKAPMKVTPGDTKRLGGAAIAMVRKGDIWQQYEFTAGQHEIINLAWKELWSEGFDLPKDNWLVEKVKAKLKKIGIEHFDIHIHSPPDDLLYDMIYYFASENKVEFPEKENFRLITHPGTHSQGGKSKPVSCNLLIPETVLNQLKRLEKDDRHAFKDWLEHEVAHLIDKISPGENNLSEKEISRQYPLYDFIDAYYLEFLFPGNYEIAASEEARKDPLGIKSSKFNSKLERALPSMEITELNKEDKETLKKQEERYLEKVIKFLSGDSFDLVDGEEVIFSTAMNETGDIYLKGVKRPVKVASERSKQCGRRTKIKFVFKETKNKEKRLCVYYYDKNLERYKLGNFYTKNDRGKLPKSFRNGDATARQLIADFFNNDINGNMEIVLNDLDVEVLARINYNGQVNFHPLSESIQICSRKSKYHKSFAKLRLFTDPNHGYMMESSVNGEIINYHFRDKTGKMVHLKPINGIMDNIISLTAIDVAAYFSGKQIKPLEGRTEIELEVPEKQNGIITLGGRYVHICQPDLFPGKRKIKLRLFERKNYGTVVEVRMKNDNGEYETTSYQYQKKVIEKETGSERVEIRYLLVGFRDGKAISSFRELDVLRYVCGEKIELVEGEEEVIIRRGIDSNGKLQFSHYDQKKSLQFSPSGKSVGTSPMATFFVDPNHGLILETSSLIGGKREIGNRYYRDSSGKIISLGGLGGVPRIISFAELDFVKYFQGEDVKVLEGRETVEVNGKVNKEGKVTFPIIGQLRVGEPSQKKERDLRFEFYEDKEGIHGLMVKCIVNGNVENHYFRDVDSEGNIQIMHFRSKKFPQFHKMQGLHELDMRAYLKGKEFDNIPERSQKITSPQKVKNDGNMNFFDIKDIAMPKKYRGANLEMEFVYNDFMDVVIECTLNEEEIGFIYYDTESSRPVFVETREEAEETAGAAMKEENTSAAIAIAQEDTMWHQHELTAEQHRVINQVWKEIWGQGYEVESSRIIEDIADILKEEKVEGLELHIHSPPEEVLYKLIYETAKKEKVEFPPRDKFRLLTHPGTWSKNGTRDPRSVNFLIPREVLTFLEQRGNSFISMKAYDEWVEHEVAHIVEKVKRARSLSKENPSKSIEKTVTEKYGISSLLVCYIRAITGGPESDERVSLEKHIKNETMDPGQKNKRGSLNGLVFLPKRAYSVVFDYLWGQRINTYNDGANVEEISDAVDYEAKGLKVILQTLCDLKLVVKEQIKKNKREKRKNIYYLSERVAKHIKDKTVGTDIELALRLLFGKEHERYKVRVDDVKIRIDKILKDAEEIRSERKIEIDLANKDKEEKEEILPKKEEVKIPEDNMKSFEKIKLFLNDKKVSLKKGETPCYIVKTVISELGEVNLEGIKKKVKVCSETQNNRHGSRYIKFELFNGTEDGNRLKISVLNNKTREFEISNMYVSNAETNTIESFRKDYSLNGQVMMRLFLRGVDVVVLNGGVMYEKHEGKPFTINSLGKVYFPGFGPIKVCRKGDYIGEKVKFALVNDLNHGKIIKCSVEESGRRVVTNIYYHDRVSGKLKHLLGAPKIKKAIGLGGMDIVSFMRLEQVEVMKEDGSPRSDIVPAERIDSSGRVNLSLYGRVDIKVCKEGIHIGKKARLVLVQDEVVGLPRLDCYVEGEHEPSNRYFQIIDDKGKKVLVNLNLAAGKYSRLITLKEFYCAAFLNGWAKDLKVKDQNNIFVSFGEIDARGQISLPFVKGNNQVGGRDLKRSKEKAIVVFKEDAVYGTIIETYCVNNEIVANIKDNNELVKIIEKQNGPDNCYYRNSRTGKIMNFRSGELSRHYNLSSIQQLDILTCLEGTALSHEQLEVMFRRSKRISAPVQMKQGMLSFFNLGKIDFGGGYYKKCPEMVLVGDLEAGPRVLCYIDSKLIGYLHSIGSGKAEFVKLDSLTSQFRESVLLEKEPENTEKPGVSDTRETAENSSKQSRITIDRQTKEIKNNEELLVEFTVPEMEGEDLDDTVALRLSLWIAQKKEFGSKQIDVEDILYELAANISEHGRGGYIKVYGTKDADGKIKYLRIEGKDAGPGIKEDFNHMAAASLIQLNNGRNNGLRNIIFKSDALKVTTNNREWERITKNKRDNKWFSRTPLGENTVGTEFVIGIKLSGEIIEPKKGNFYESSLEKTGYEEFFTGEVPNKGYFTKENNPAQIFIDTVLNGNFVYEEKKMKTVLVMGTDWIWEYNSKSALQYTDINRLLVLVRKLCEENNIEFITCPDEDIPERVKDIDTNKTKLAILAGTNTLFSDDKRIKELKQDESVYFAGVEALKIEEELSYHRITEMLGLLLRLTYKQNISRYSGSGIVCYRSKENSNVFMFVPLPEADVLDLEEMRIRYDLMCDIIQNA